MTDSRFYKLSGGGNDFVAFAEPHRAPEPSEIRALCRRGVSVGADGLFVLRRETCGVHMDYWNADGRPAELCLNGTRCAAQLAKHLGWADDTVTVLTETGGIEATILDNHTIMLDVPPPSSAPRALTVPRATGAPELQHGWVLEVGVPHFVLRWADSLATAPVETLGSSLRHAPEFAPAGTNVMFVRFPAPDRLEIRSYERGVEAETLACGTGILAATAVGVSLGDLALPLEVSTLGGFPFAVAGEMEGGRVLRWSLTGDARLLAIGSLQPAAVAASAPPNWSG